MSRPRVFLDVNIGAEPVGRLVIELFSDQAPKTCENFHALCTGSKAGMSYKLSPFHRIIDEFMVQGGDITNGDGTGGESIYGGEFEDENLNWREIDTDSLLCMANHGKDTNSSQFFITLAACEHLNGKHTVFGRLLSGQETLQRIAEVAVDSNDRPKTDVVVANCGELERRKKMPAPDRPELKTRGTFESDMSRGRPKRRRPSSDMSSSSSPSRSRSRSRDDTRRRRRHRRGSSRSTSPVPTKKRARRRSDYTVDENLRGRTRRRSTTVSPVEEERPEERKQERPEERERRRSSSPSRGPREYGHSPGFRRRKSLPNHYERYYGDEKYIQERERERDGGDDRYADAYMDDEPRPVKSHRNNGRMDDGRLGGGDSYGRDGNEGGVKFKGRGAMKYREKTRN